MQLTDQAKDEFKCKRTAGKKDGTSSNHNVCMDGALSFEKHASLWVGFNTDAGVAIKHRLRTDAQ